MGAGEVVLVASQRLDERAMLERVGEGEPALVAGIGIEVGQDLVHTAELGVEHFLDLRVVKFGEDTFGPRGKFGLQIQSGAVAGEAVSVTQSGIILVKHVPRRPETVEIKTA